MNINLSYIVVNSVDLVAILGKDCSPDLQRKFHVIGPDAMGRLCHIASCCSEHDAKTRARRLNNSVIANNNLLFD